MPGLLSGDTAGATALKHERRKIEVYSDLRPPYTLTPLIHEQFGRMGQRANSFLGQLALAVHKSGQILSTTAPHRGPIQEPPLAATLCLLRPSIRS